MNLHKLFAAVFAGIICIVGFLTPSLASTEVEQADTSAPPVIRVTTPAVNGPWGLECFADEIAGQLGCTMEQAYLDLSPKQAQPAATGQKLRVQGHEYTLVVSGDLNGDGKITIADMVELARVISGTPTGENAYMAADLNEDGSVTISDLVAIAPMLTGKATGSILDQMRSTALILENRLRCQEDRFPQRYLSFMNNCAQARAEEMAAAEIMSHTRPDGAEWSTIFPEDIYFAIGSTGENIYSIETPLWQEVPSAAIHWWNGSKTHHDNMMNPSFRYMGIEFAQGESGIWYVCQLFCCADPQGTVDNTAYTVPDDLDFWNQKVLDDINALRIANGTAPLEPLPMLMEATQIRVEEMASTGSLLQRPNGLIWTTIFPNWQEWGKLLRQGIQDPCVLLEEHEADLLYHLSGIPADDMQSVCNPIYKYVGVGWVRAADGSLFVHLLLSEKDASANTTLNYLS